ncbi:MAG: hypothetical protein AAF799_28915 [Myxococcota bacterium]
MAHAVLLGVSRRCVRRTLQALALTSPLAWAACSDPIVPIDPEESTGVAEESTTVFGTGTESMTGQVGATGSTGSLDTTMGVEESSEGEETTEGAQPSGGRFVVFDTASFRGLGEPLLYTYAEGELSAPQTLTPALPPTTFTHSIEVVDDGHGVAYCTRDDEDPNTSCFVVNISTDTPGASQPFGVDPLPAASQLSIEQYIPQTQTFLVWARDHAEGAPPDNAALFTLIYQDGVLEAPELTVPHDEDAPFDLYDMHPSPDGQTLAFATNPAQGPGEVYLASLTAPDPASIARVSAVLDPQRRAVEPRVAPGGQALTYLETPWSSPELPDALYFVDLSGPTPADPIRIDTVPPERPWLVGPAFAPDGSALVYWSGVAVGGDLYFVDLATGSPSPASLVHTDPPGQVLHQHFDWSPDGRWLLYLVRMPTGADVLHLAEYTGSGLGPSVPLTDLPSVNHDRPWFDPTSTWLYYEQEHELARTNLSGAEPGLSQRVGAAAPPFLFSFFPTRDPATMMYSAVHPKTGERSLHAVDIGASRPGRPQRLDGPLARDWILSWFIEPAWDASFALFFECSPARDACADISEDSAYALQLADRSTGEVVPVSQTALVARAVAPAQR